MNDREPAYVFYKAESQAIAFILWVPDASPVKEKMLFSSSRNNVTRQLGSRVSTTIFWCEKDEIDLSSFKSSIKSRSKASNDDSATPEDAGVLEVNHSNRNRSHMGRGISLPLSQDAMEAVQKFSTTDHHLCIQLMVEIRGESIELDSTTETGDFNEFVNTIPSHCPRYSIFTVGMQEDRKFGLLAH